MRFVRKVIEWAGNLFSGGLCILLIGLGLVGKITGSGNFQIEMLPWWSGQELVSVLLYGGIFGLIATTLAASGKFRLLLPVWTFTVLVAMVWGYLISNYKYDGYDQFRESINLILAQVTTFGASVSQALRKA